MENPATVTKRRMVIPRKKNIPVSKMAILLRFRPHSPR
jgi:hypothetical protein